MSTTNKDQSKEKLLTVQEKVDVLKNTMYDNILKATDNTQKLNDLESRAEELANDSNIFNNGAKQLQQKMWWKKVKTYIAIGSVIAIILTILIVVVVLSSENNSNSRKLYTVDENISIIKLFSNFVFFKLTKIINFFSYSTKYLKKVFEFNNLNTFNNLRGIYQINEKFLGNGSRF